MNEQLTKRAKRFFKYVEEFTALENPAVRSIKDYKQIWNINDLYLYELLDSKVQLKQRAEIHKPILEQTFLVAPKPYPEISPKIALIYKKEHTAPVYKHAFQLEENLLQKEGANRNRHSKTIEWTKWVVRKKNYDKACSLYNELCEWVEKLNGDSDLEVVLAKGLFNWQDGEHVIELPVFTQSLALNKNKDTITINTKDDPYSFDQHLLENFSEEQQTQVAALLDNIVPDKFFNDESEILNKIAPYCHPEAEVGNQAHEKKPILFDESYIIIRHKNQIRLKKDLQNLVQDLEHENSAPTEALYSVLGLPQKKRESSSVAKGQLFLPLDVPEEQKQVVKKLEHMSAISVRTSNNSVKSEAIKNIVAHYLANGKKVLVATNREELAAIKNDLPKHLHPLCVHITSDVKNSKEQIEQSIQVVGERLDNTNMRKGLEKVKQKQLRLQMSVEQEQASLNELRQYHLSEGKPFLFENKEWYKHDVAKYLSTDSKPFDWIRDDLPLVMKFPLSHEEWKEFGRIHNSLTKEDTILLHTTVPSPGEMMNEATFKILLEEEQKLEESIDVRHILPIELESSKKSALLIMQAYVDDILTNYEIVEDESVHGFLEDVLGDEKRKEDWKNVIDQIKALNNKALEMYHEISHHQIRLPKKLTVDIKKDLRMVRDRMLAGKKPNALFMLGKGKATRYLFETPVLNGKPLRNFEDVAIMLRYIEYRTLITQLSRMYNGKISEVRFPQIDIRHPQFPLILHEKIELLEHLISIADTDMALSQKLVSEKLEKTNLFNQLCYEKLKIEISHTLAYLKYEKWQENFFDRTQQLRAIAQLKHMHPIYNAFLNAMVEKDALKWKELLTELKIQRKLQKDIHKWKHYIDLLSHSLPLTAGDLIDLLGEAKVPEDDAIESFVLKKMATWLSGSRHLQPNILHAKLKQERVLQKKLTEELIQPVSWLSTLKQITPAEKTAITNWRFYNKKMKKDRAKFAPHFKQEADNILKQAQSAIPVWLMPLSEVTKYWSIPGNYFDVVIVDGMGSLSDLQVLLRGEKAIIFGDEATTKKLSSKLSQEEIAVLMNNYIKDFPNYSLYDGTMSMFEIAQHQLPDKAKIELSNTTSFILTTEDHATSSTFVADLQNELMTRGYRFMPTIKKGPLSIDLALESSHGRLAIICGGRKWTNQSEIDELESCQHQMEQAGWTFWHISGREYYLDHSKTMEKLLSLINFMKIKPQSLVQNQPTPSLHFQINQKPTSVDQN